jgi:rhamnosyltransferase
VSKDENQPIVQPNFWVIVPTLNPGLEAWAKWIHALQVQNCMPSQVVVVDSGSSDGSLALSKKAGFTVLHTHAQEFNHGATRQWALQQAKIQAQETQLTLADFGVFLTQDAFLVHPNALAQLLQAFEQPQVAAAYGRQLPQANASWLESHARSFNYPEASKTVQLQDKESLGIKTCFLSNSFAAYRLLALEAQGGFPHHVPLGEDTYIAAKLLLSGHSVSYQANASVYHSHNHNWQQDFQRMFDTGVFHTQNPWLIQTFGTANREGVKLLRSQWKSLKKQQSLHPLIALAHMLATNVCKLLGYRLGLNYRYLPNAAVLKCSMHPYFWQQQK